MGYSQLKSVFLFLLCLLSLNIGAQTYTGRVVDSEGASLPTAQLILRIGQQIKGFSITDSDGAFTLIVPTALIDSIELEVRSFGYATKLIATDEINSAILRKIILNEDAVALKEVLVSASVLPRVNRGDTIAFNTKAYSDGSEDKIEDVLAKLPGVEVDDNGKIKVQGKPLDRILVDGEDLFDKDYKLLSRNVPADYVTQIEVMSNYQSDALVGDLEGKGGVALNLKLDPGKKGITFGEVAGNLGNSNYRQARVNLFHLGKKMKTINFSDYGTLGAASTAGGDLLLKSQGLGSQQPVSSQGILRSAATRRNRLVRETDYLNNESLGTASSMLFKVGQNAENRLLLNVLKDKFNFDEEQLRETVTGQGVESFRQESQQDYNSTRIWIKNDLKLALNRNSRIDVRASLSGNLTKMSTKVLNEKIGSSTVDELGTNLEETPLNHLLGLRYVRRIKPGLALRLIANWQVDNYNQQQAYRGSVYNNIFPLHDYSVVEQLMNQQTQNLALELNVLHQLNEDKLDYSVGQRNLRSTITSALRSEGNGENVFPDLTRNNQSESYLKTSWARKWEQFSASAMLKGSLFKLNNTGRGTSEVNQLAKTVLQSQLDLSYQLNARNKFRLWANDGRKAPGIEQTINSPYLADGTTLSLGLDSSYLLREYSFGLNYSYDNKFGQYGYGIRLFSTMMPNAVQSSLMTNDYVIVEQLLPGAKSSLNSAFFNFNFYVPKQKTHIKTTVRLTQIENQLDFGEDFLSVLSTNYRFGLRVNTQFAKSFKYGFYMAYDVFQNKLSEERTSQSQLHLGNKWVVTMNKNVKTIFRYDVYLPRLGNDDRVIQLLGFETVFKPRESKWELGFGGANLLNQGAVIEQSIASYQRFTRSYRLRPRSVYLLASWSF